MDEDRVDAARATPIQPLLDAVDALARPRASSRRSSASSSGIGGGGLFGSYVDTDDRNSDRYLVNVVQGGIGLPDESYYREEKFAEIREKYVAYLERMLTLAEPRRRRAGAGAPVLGARDPAGRRATGSAPRPATSRRPTT